MRLIGMISAPILAIALPHLSPYAQVRDADSALAAELVPRQNTSVIKSVIKSEINSMITSVHSANSQPLAQTVLYVNPRGGSDRPEYGDRTTPLKTITYALSRVKTGQTTIIQLANGSYNQNTGERFPLLLPQGVTLRGDESNKGRDIVIAGGGAWRTKTTALPQNVTIAFADGSELRGVTVTNPHNRGYGLWIENVSPAIANNTFIDNQQDGGLVTGKSRAMIITNQFFRNGTSGLAIEGESSPEVRGNLFQQTTYGMSIRQEAAPQVIENTLTQNQNGMLIQGSAKPLLRGNAIMNNRDYGITILDAANPDLGKVNDEGLNTLKGNGKLDLQNVTRTTVAMVGNFLDAQRVKGKLQLSDVRPPANLFAAVMANAAPPKNLGNATTQRLHNLQSDNNLALANAQVGDRLASLNQQPIAPPTNPFWYEPVNSVIIRITPRRTNSPVPNNAEITANLRPVRSAPPSGEPVNQPIIIAPLGDTSMAPQEPPRYRVVVPVASENTVAQVKRIVPHAFPSRLNGYLVVQIGAYSDRRIAEAQVSSLAARGLTARIEAIRR
jgi:parallel beta-helix repeat protein